MDKSENIEKFIVLRSYTRGYNLAAYKCKKEMAPMKLTAKVPD